MIILNRNNIIIPTTYKYYEFLRRYLIKVYLEKNMTYFSFINSINEKTIYNIPDIDAQVDYLNKYLRSRPFDKCDCLYKIFYLYELGESMELIIPIGYLEFIKPFLDYSDLKINYDISNPLVNTPSVLKKVDNKLLPGITLRDEQLTGIDYALRLKRTIIQMGTGGGKSEIMCAIIKVLEKELGYIPTTLLLEPTDKLKKEMIERFTKYNLPAIDYNEERSIKENFINIAHPTSLNNDLEKDNNILKNVLVYFSDECHHQKATSYNATAINVPNAEYMIGVSASAVGQDHVFSKDLKDYEVEELKGISMMGLVSYNVTAKELISKGKLAEPVLLVVNNLANEFIKKNKQSDWHVISKVHLRSETRTNQICKVAVNFSQRKLKTLILINNKEWAQDLAKKIDSLGFGDQCRLSFGGNTFLKYNNIEETFEKDKETFEKFHTGEVSILIGTQHLIEGIDVPSLDCVILPAIGKSERIQIQSCGRVLRLTKNGNMAYIVDFSDECDPILNYQFKTRISTYINTIGIKPENIFVINRDKIDDELSIIFNKYENEKEENL